MRRIPLISGRYRNLIAAVALSVAIVASSLLVAHFKSQHSNNVARQIGSSNPGISIIHMSKHRRLKDAPTCGPASGQIPAVIQMTLSTDTSSFSQDCYYAPANQTFTIDFTNSIVGTGDGSDVTLTLVISPSQDPAIEPVSGQPGVYAGSTASAVFVGSPVTAPQSVELSVPALSPGTYDLQFLESFQPIATLVVQ